MKTDSVSLPLVSVITVCFNLVNEGRTAYFKQCVTSVQEQSYPNIEHIVIDGGSQDGTVDLLKSVKADIDKTKKVDFKYISEPDHGIYDAMNKGIKQARGKYIAFLNSDDYWHEANGIEQSVAALERSNASFSYAPRRVVNGEGKLLFYENAAIGIFAESMPFCHQTMFTRRDVLLKHNGFDNLRYRYAADYDLIMRILLNGHSCIYVPYNFTTFRRGGFSETSLSDREVYSIQKNLLGEHAANMLNQGYMDDNLMQHIMSLVHRDVAVDIIRCHKATAPGIHVILYGLTKFDATGKINAGFEIRKVTKWSIFMLPIITMKQRKNRTSVSLFSIIPLGRWRRKNNMTTFLLFGFIPIFSSSIKIAN